MGVCTSKQNRASEVLKLNSRHSALSNSLLNNSKQKPIMKKFNSPIIIGFIRQIVEKFNHAHNYNLYNLPSEIKQLCTLYFGSIHEDLIIQQNQTLRLNDLKHKIFEYNSILIRKNATLTLNRWNSNTKNGGLLNITCVGNIILEDGAKISMSGRGYHGGDHGRNGKSYVKSKCNKTRKPNFGGGGGGQVSIFSEFGAQSSCGGGGGYGARGNEGKRLLKFDNDSDSDGDMIVMNDNIEYGMGGDIYGDMYLSKLHFGSGGGSGYYFDEMDNSLRSNKGGAGGGAIRIKCFGNIIMHNNSKILCNGNKGKGMMAGSGSGGSIYIIIDKENNLQMNGNAKIEAIGGKNINNIGNGGDGRTRVEFSSKDNYIDTENISYHNITPMPYVG